MELLRKKNRPRSGALEEKSVHADDKKGAPVELWRKNVHVDYKKGPQWSFEGLKVKKVGRETFLRTQTLYNFLNPEVWLRARDSA